MAAIIRRTAKSTKQLCQEGGLLNDIISKSEEHFGADSMRWDMLWLSAYCNYVKHTALLSLQRRAWT
jgi:hypothetical protein